MNKEMKQPNSNRKAIMFWAVSGLALMALGLLLILIYGVEVIPKPSSAPNLLWLVCLLAFFGVMLLARGIITKSSGPFWLSCVFLWCAAVVAAGIYTDWGFGQIYPAFILAPAVASALTWLFYASKAAHLKTIVFFSAISLILFLNSITAIALKWYWIVGILLVAFGAMLFLNAFTTKRGRWDDADPAPVPVPVPVPRALEIEGEKPKKKKRWDDADPHPKAVDGNKK